MYEATTPTTVSEASDEECETSSQDFKTSKIHKTGFLKRDDSTVCMNGAKRLGAFVNCTKDEFSSDDNCLFGK